MTKKILASQRQGADYGWLKTHYLFSFANYYDPQNIHFGNLRVFNDDWIAPHEGFEPHQHANMEIVTIVNNGTVSHKDSMGNEGTVSAGEIQRMSAGIGVTHSEKNDGDAPLELFQIWMLPREDGLLPSYDQMPFTYPEQGLQLLATDEKVDGAMQLNSKNKIFTGKLAPNTELTYELAPNKGFFMYVTGGEVKIGNETFAEKDQARIVDEPSIVLSSSLGASFILIEVTR